MPNLVSGPAGATATVRSVDSWNLADLFELAEYARSRGLHVVLSTNGTLIDRAIAEEGTKVMLLMRLSGFPPFTWINYALGLTGVALRPYVLTTFFGIIPGVLAFTWAGAAGAAALTGTGNRLALIVTAAGAVLVSVFIARIATRAIRRAGVPR